MVRITSALLTLASVAAFASAQQCSGNGSMCPNNQDGVSNTYLQCNSWSHTYQNAYCPTGQVCYANPNSPGTTMCGLPGTGGSGKCTGNTAKCVSAGQSGAYQQCENWSGQYVNANCPAGLNCYNNASNTGVYCQ
ncbi:hypothetical protein GGI02_002998 [Coemansia sp. RSA 2322]|uniref:Secreted protein n=1 Tax=Coemansia thaxteri TaxID=2663907 RepID=A0A9W8BC05_9FUNG|nr:hypothetical protein H4R26_003835 [Coemansia thaxteri]KAJ2470329.1 hypothetical protein GGI02_002998 [Coemansia sp. RSA 2322]